MRIKLAENLPGGLVALLADLGHDVDTVPVEGIGGQVQLPQPGRTALLDRIASLFRTEAVDTWPRCLVIATARKVRVRRPL